jgi:hypothetical protein
MDEMEERELAEATEQLAKWARHFYLRLLAEGFAPSEALALTRTWLSGMSPNG